MNEIKKELNIRTKELRNVLEKAFQQEKLEYDSIHPSYNIKSTRNDYQKLFITCYVEKNNPYGIHIDNRLEVEKWVIDIVIMKPDLTFEIINKLKNNGFNYEEYNEECKGEFKGHIKLVELEKDTSNNEIKDINIKLLKLFQ